MLTSEVVEGTNIVTVAYDGSLSADEMKEARENLSSVAQRHGAAKLLVEYGDIDIGRIEPKAAWEDLKTIGQLDDVSKLALVTDKGWVQSVGETAGTLTSTDVEIFDEDERDEALVWLRA